MINILIVGGGKIGSRHLQGILLSKNQLNITVVDPSLESLNLCQVRAKEFNNINTNKKITFRQTLPKNENFEICIISTNSDIRAKVTEDLLASCLIRHIVFEKVLFQREIDYYNISKLIKSKKVNAWVNCPYRTYNFYKEIKKTLNINSVIEMNVKGSSWGMACNSIHYIDLFSYIVDSSDLSITTLSLSNNLISSKRGNKFSEINGFMVFKINDHLLSISCDENKKRSLSININCEKIKHYINEEKKKWKSDVNGLTQIQNFHMAGVSELSGKLVDNLIENNQCGLASYEESCRLHLPLITQFRMHFSKILKKEIIECPIT